MPAQYDGYTISLPSLTTGDLLELDQNGDSYTEDSLSEAVTLWQNAQNAALEAAFPGARIDRGSHVPDRITVYPPTGDVSDDALAATVGYVLTDVLNSDAMQPVYDALVEQSEAESLY